jgi:hypothetical protein
MLSILGTAEESVTESTSCKNGVCETTRVTCVDGECKTETFSADADSTSQDSQMGMGMGMGEGMDSSMPPCYGFNCSLVVGTNTGGSMPPCPAAGCRGAFTLPLNFCSHSPRRSLC